MNNLLFTALCLALLYYYFFYQPSLKKISTPTFTNQASQTERAVANKTVQTEETIFSPDQLAQFTTEWTGKITSLETDLTNSREGQQKLLEQLNFFTRNKELIREITEFRRNLASGALAENESSESLDFDLKNIESKINYYATCDVENSDDEEEIKRLESERRYLLEIKKLRQDRTGNSEMVRRCQELLKHLEEDE